MQGWQGGWQQRGPVEGGAKDDQGEEPESSCRRGGAQVAQVGVQLPDSDDIGMTLIFNPSASAVMEVKLKTLW